VQTHCRVQHRLSGEQLRTVAIFQEETLDSHLKQSYKPEIPSLIRQPDPDLHLYEDGFLCVLSRTCRYVCRNRRNIQQHCREKHGWTENSRRGRPPKKGDRLRTTTTTTTTTQSIIQGWKVVCCQRVFASGPDSHFIAVETPTVDLKAISATPTLTCS
jgi:hypothetical protein